ncbi:MAG: glutathione S-transferase family protein [Parvibaculum sp.]|nr:glutathione S-transferase family protein [Parvibaculum sp.]
MPEDEKPDAPAMLAGLKLYGLDLSYFTGKFEAFVRYKNIPHQRIEFSLTLMREIARRTGLAQMPAVELPDGRWMSDSTPMIEWLDANTNGPRVIPADPVQQFLSLLVEDYADEWLWRPALHYRWSYKPDARLMGHRIASEMLRDVRAPLWLRRFFVIRRQQRVYLRHDGVTPATIPHIESTYRRNLAFLDTIFAARPFMLGDRPTLADFGFFASMFRHFGLDPTPARIMRDEAPHVYEWLGRMWNAKASKLNGALVDEGTVPADWQPILTDIGASYLPYLNANARAYQKGDTHYRFETEGTTYHLPVHRYRVWCLERLQGRWRALAPDMQARVSAILAGTNCIETLTTVANLKSGFDPDHLSPFFKPGHIWSDKNGPKETHHDPHL